MYKLCRQIHFIAASTTGIFLLLFFITGLLLVKYNWFQHDEIKPHIEQYVLALPSYSTDHELAKWVKYKLDINGKIDWIKREKNGEVLIEIVTPQRFHLIRALTDENQLTLTHEYSPQSAYGTISVLHRVHQYGGGFLYDIYLFAMDLSSIALFVFSITGVYLWLTLIKRKWIGIAVLSLGIGYTIWVIATFLA